MASPDAMEKLRAVLDYVPEDVAQGLPGDDPDYYDALTHRLHRSVAVTRMVHRRVIVEQADEGDLPEPPAPSWVPPAPVDVQEPGVVFTRPEPTAAAPPSADLLAPAAAEAVTVVEAMPPRAPPRPRPAARAPAPSVTATAEDDLFDVVQRESAAGEMEPLEPEIALSESDWQDLEAGPTEGSPEEEQAWEPEAVPEPVPREYPAEAPFEAPAEALEGEFIETMEEPPEEAQEEALLEAPGYRETELEEVPFDASELPEAETLAAGPVETELEILEETEEPWPTDAPEAPREPAQAGYQRNGYTLFHRAQRGDDGTLRDSYFFSPETWLPDAEPSPIPQGYEVVVNPQTSAPAIRRAGPRVVRVAELSAAGVGPIMAERLERAGVRTAADLAAADVASVASETGIRVPLLRDVRAVAGLLQVEGISPTEAAMLVRAGVRDLDDLRSADPAATALALDRAAREQGLTLPVHASAARVAAWQDEAARSR